MKSLNILILSTLLFVASTVRAQEFKVDPFNSIMKIEGTSTLHDWHSEALNISGDANMSLNGKEISDVSDLSLSVAVRSIKSGKNGMDKNAWEALKSADFPEIKFSLVRIEEVNATALQGIGLLTIAGATREVSMDVSYSIDDSGIIIFTGYLDLNMSSYEIDPPTALLGTVKTGDPVKITYSVTFKAA